MSLSTFVSKFKSDEALVLSHAKAFFDGAQKVLNSIEGHPEAVALVEGVTKALGGQSAVSVEMGVVNAAGELSRLVNDAQNGANNTQQLLNIGFDQQVLTDFKSVVAAAKAI